MKKVKCSETQPVCNYCSRHGFRCEYPSQSAGRFVLYSVTKLPGLRLKRSNSNDRVLAQVLTRLQSVEERLQSITEFGQKPETGETEHRQTESSPRISSNPSVSSPRGDAEPYNLPDRVDSHAQTRTDFPRENKSAGDCNASSIFPQVATEATRYVKQSPLACEENRPPLPDCLVGSEPTDLIQLLPRLKEFFELTFALYPVICNQASFAMASDVQTRGIQADVPSCLVLLMVALSQAYRRHAPLESGLADFQNAMQLLSRINVEFTLAYSQTQVLSALFLLKKGRLLGFWFYLHAGCTILHSMIRR
jgi:hypothetical protein